MALKTYVGLLLPFALFCTTSGLTCSACDKSACVLPDCKGGSVLDPCQCCYVCAKQEDETCGGYVHGQCDMGLSCVVQLERGKLVTGNEEGTCRPTVNVLGDTEFCKPTAYYGCNITNHDCVCGTEIACSNPQQFQNIHLCQLNLAKEEELKRDCAAKRCDIQPSPTCPDDSEVQPGYLPRGSCCPLPSKCVCNMAKCRAQICHPSTEKRLVRQGSNQPGSCCNVYECRPIENDVDCSRVHCGVNAASKDICPEDSEMLPANSERRECCGQTTVCKCRNQECEVPSCADGLRLQVLFRGDGNPGACCDVYQCSAEPLVAGCALQGRQFQSGETYELPDCRRCECKNGVSLCEPHLCPALNCNRLVKPANECCAVCADDQNGDPSVPYPLCRDGDQHYSIGDTWEPDHCTQCECVEGGKKRCKASYCQGGSVSTQTLPDSCPTLDDCDLSDDDCPFGFQRDAQNCRTCACIQVQCPTFTDCNINCPGGFEKDSDNCPVCKCKSTRCKDMSSCTKQCPYGFKKQKNGCDKCRCRRCPLMDECNRNCPSGLDHDRFGCTICKCRDTTAASTLPSAGGSACQDEEANKRRDDGEVWSSGCYICMCKGGKVMCDLLKCPLPTCDNPTMKNGECCPSCDADSDRVSDVPPSMTCQVPSGKGYVEGEIWDMDDNLTCTCYNANMLCSTAWCPPTPCDNPAKVDGQRCPVCSGEVVDNNGGTCTVESRQYNVGDSWKVSECETCVCQESLQVKCFTKSCPKTYDCEQPVLRHGDCCPTCLETTIDRSSAPESSNTSCYIDGTQYKHGDKWQDQCQSCTCVQGHASCRVTQCGVLPPSCPHVIHDGCCQKCDYSNSDVVVSEAQDGSRRTIVVATTVSVLVVVAVLAAVAGYCVRKRRRSHTKYQTQIVSAEGNSRPGHRHNSTKPLMSSSSEDGTVDCARAQHV